MIERGLIVNIENNRAVVELAQRKECASCKLCSGVGGKQQLKVELDKIDLFEVGQEVVVEISSSETLKGGFFVFILPLIAFIMGAWGGPKVFELLNISIGADLERMIAGFGLLSLSLVAVTLLYRSEKKKQKLKPRIKVPLIMHKSQKL